MNMARSSSHSSVRHIRNTRVPDLTGCSAKKACPTVSITNANVSRAMTACLIQSPSNQSLPSARSSVPFPSSPIPIPTPRDDTRGAREPGLQPPEDQETSKEQAAPRPQPHPPAPNADWPTVRRRCSNSCLASSYLSRDSGQPIVRHMVQNCQNNSQRSDARKQDGKPQGSTGWRSSMSSPSPRRTGKMRKSTADLQFIALVHRSIAWRARSARDTQRESDGCAAQDVLLAKRLWQSLARQGCKPVMFAGAGGKGEPALCAQTHVQVSVPKATPEPQMPSDSDAILYSIPFIPPSVQSSRRITSKGRARCTPSSPPEDRILSMPQLVACLTLRYRDRCASHLRQTSGVNSAASLSMARPQSPVVQRPPSSLARVAYSSYELAGSSQEESS